MAKTPGTPPNQSTSSKSNAARPKPRPKKPKMDPPGPALPSSSYQLQPNRKEKPRSLTKPHSGTRGQHSAIEDVVNDDVESEKKEKRKKNKPSRQFQASLSYRRADGSSSNGDRFTTAA